MKKKIKFLVAIMFAAFICSTPVYAESCYVTCKGISDHIDSKLPNTVHLVIVAIQIAVPVLLVNSMIISTVCTG